MKEGGGGGEGITGQVGYFQNPRGLSSSPSFLSSPTPPRSFYSRHFSRCLWLSFLDCSKTVRKRLLRRPQSKENCFKNLTHFSPYRIPPSCTNKLTINCSTLQGRLKFHCSTLRRRKMRLQRFSVGSSFTLHLIHVYVKQVNLTIKLSSTLKMFKFYISKIAWGMQNEWKQENFCSQTRLGGEICSPEVNMHRGNFGGNCFGFVLLCYVIG